MVLSSSTLMAMLIAHVKVASVCLYDHAFYLANTLPDIVTYTLAQTTHGE